MCYSLLVLCFGHRHRMRSVHVHVYCTCMHNNYIDNCMHVARYSIIIIILFSLTLYCICKLIESDSSACMHNYITTYTVISQSVCDSTVPVLSLCENPLSEDDWLSELTAVEIKLTSVTISWTPLESPVSPINQSYEILFRMFTDPALHNWNVTTPVRQLSYSL